MMNKIETIQSRIMTLTVAISIMKMIGWVAIAWMLILAIIHVEQYGLKHLIEILWLGPGA